jgi:hypothetical protein
MPKKRAPEYGDRTKTIKLISGFTDQQYKDLTKLLGERNVTRDNELLTFPKSMAPLVIKKLVACKVVWEN